MEKELADNVLLVSYHNENDNYHASQWHKTTCALQ